MERTQEPADDQAPAVAAPQQREPVAAGGWIALQRSAGNRAVARLISVMRDATAPAPTTTPGQQAVVKAKAGDWIGAATILVGLDMAGLLDAVEEFRRAKLLQPLSDTLAYMPIVRRPQLKAALLAVGGLLGFRLSTAEEALSQADRDAIREHVAQRLLAGDVDAPEPLERWDGQRFKPSSPDVTDLGWIEQFLDFFGFGTPPLHDPTEQACRFNRHWTTVDEVMDIVKAQGAVDGRLLTDDKAIRDAVAHAYQAKRGDAKSIHFSYTITFVPTTVHTNLSQPGSSSDNPAVQPQGSLIFQFHHDDEPGWELSVIAQATFFKDPDGSFRLQNVAAGGQAAWVIPFAKANLQSQTFVQLLGGAAIRGHTIDNVQATTKDPSAQAVLGQQVSVWLDADHHWFLGVQATLGTTATAPPKDSKGRAVRDQPGVTLDWGGGLVFGAQW